MGRDKLIDAWRGISICLVIGGHLANRYLEGSYPGVVEAGLQLAGLGVKFFFVISGFVITRLLLEERERQGTIRLGAFYVRRALRILPALWCFVLFVFAMDRAGAISLSPISYAATLGFVCNTGLVACSKYLDHTWSLSIEEQFYIVWPLALLLCARKWRAHLCLGAMICFMAISQVPLGIVGWVNNGLSFACIAFGALYALSPSLQSWIGAVASVPTLALAAVVLFTRPMVPIVFAGQYRLNDLATPLLVGFLIFGCMAYRSSLTGRPLVRALAAVGLVSYSLYVWQQPFLTPYENLIGQSVLDWSFAFVPIALLSYWFIEQPLIRVGRRISRSMSSSRLEPVAR